LARRDARFADSLRGVLDNDEMTGERTVVGMLEAAGYNPAEIAAAAIRIARASEASRPIDAVAEVSDRPRRYEGERGGRYEGGREEGGRFRRPRGEEAGMVRLMLNVGRAEGIRPGDVVGAIASEAGIPGKSIGAINIQHNQTFVDVQEQHAERVLRSMGRWTLRGRPITLTRANGGGGDDRPTPRRRRAERRVEGA
jgi:ATP-dependent RNA helicase DeaD